MILARFERATYCLEGSCSVHLSYRTVTFDWARTNYLLFRRQALCPYELQRHDGSRGSRTLNPLKALVSKTNVYASSTTDPYFYKVAGGSRTLYLYLHRVAQHQICLSHSPRSPSRTEDNLVFGQGLYQLS